MICPLCDTQKNITVRRYELSDLRRHWNQSFGFDPFPNDFRCKYINKKQCSACKLIYFDPSYFGDGHFYSTISKNLWYYEENKWEYDVAAEIVSQLSAGSVLEIGCGNGHFLDKISSLGMRVQGVDINADAVALCQAKGLQVEAADVFDLTTTYDLVVSFQVLEHLENPKRLFEFLANKLVSPGGHIVIAVPNPDGYLKDMEMNLLDMPPHHNSSWSLATFEHLASQFGLQLVAYEKEPIRYVHYLGMIQNTIMNYAKLASNTLKSRLLIKLQSFIVRMLSPLSYLQDKDNVDGQTHLVVLKHVR
jgi:2-polyprenyl-3-methyl-5-hydroxy-6-metoxy-1,4-benzoquinol methylase